MNRMQEDVLGRALHEEGKRMGPAHSRLMHERVMRELAECGMEVSPERRRGKRKWMVGVPLGVAAGLAIAAGTWMMLRPPAEGGGGMAGSQTRVSKAGPLEMPNIMQLQKVIAPEGADAEGSETLEQARYASLNRDAEKFVSFVADQVPSFSSE